MRLTATFTEATLASQHAFGRALQYTETVTVAQKNRAGPNQGSRPAYMSRAVSRLPPRKSGSEAKVISSRRREQLRNHKSVPLRNRKPAQRRSRCCSSFCIRRRASSADRHGSSCSKEPELRSKPEQLHIRRNPMQQRHIRNRQRPHRIRRSRQHPLHHRRPEPGSKR